MFPVYICPIITQKMCALTCICVSQVLVKDLDFLCFKIPVTEFQPIVSSKQPIVFPLAPLYNVVMLAYA